MTVCIVLNYTSASLYYVVRTTEPLARRTLLYLPLRIVILRRTASDLLIKLSEAPLSTRKTTSLLFIDPTTDNNLLSTYLITLFIFV